MSLGNRLDRSIRSVGDRMMRLPFVRRRWLVLARDLYAYSYVRRVNWRINRRYRATIEPTRLLRVDPDAIRKVSTRAYATEIGGNDVPPRFKLVGRVEDGSWDRLTSYPRESLGRVPKATVDTHVEFSDTYVYRALRHRFDRGGRWEETEYFDLLLEEIRDGNAPWDCHTAGDLRERCRYLDELYEAVREDGYRTQAELHGPMNRISEAVRTVENEISVDVARDGRFLFTDGRHRLAIAKLLELDEVPVVVQVRHEQWQQLRDDVAAGRTPVESLPAGVRDNPDVRSLVDDDR